jgi:hypothetical protein
MADIRITPGSSIMAFTSSLSYKQTITQDPSGSVVLYGSGSTNRTNIFAIDGASGRLFSVTDDFSNSLFSANTISGLPVIEAFADSTVKIGKYGQEAIVVSGSGGDLQLSGSIKLPSLVTAADTNVVVFNTTSKKISYNTALSLQGVQGIQGTYGNQGTTGTATQGTTGTSVQGIQGIYGAQGTTGTATQGTTGTSVQGIQGIYGAQGTTGTSVQGTTGTATQGTTGTSVQGIQGIYGAQGTTGTSVQGSTGTATQGATGTSVQGATGTATQGTAGTSVQGTTGTSVQGATGTSVQGATGTSVQGIQGIYGAQGTTGTSVQGSTGAGASIAGPGNGVVYSDGGGGSLTSTKINVNNENLYLKDTASVPNAAAGQVTLYADPLGGFSELKVIDAAGNRTVLSPHNFSLIPEGASEPLAWSYYSEQGDATINVDMLKMARLLEQITGEKLVYIK